MLLKERIDDRMIKATIKSDVLWTDKKNDLKRDWASEKDLKWWSKSNEQWSEYTQW